MPRLKRGMTSEEHAAAFPRLVQPGLSRSPPMKRAQGMPDAGRTHGPPATKKQAAVTTGKAGTTGIPCAMVLRLIRALPGVPGLLASVALRNVSQRLIPASGDQDHAISPSALAAFVNGAKTSIASRSQ